MNSACNFEGCTVGDTGICALEKDPATCGNRIRSVSVPATASADEPASTTGGSVIGSPVLERPRGAATFPASHTLGPDAMSSLMASRYVTVVGILGDPNSGKTACLASTYLLVANAMLQGWSFADSKSLMGFEDIARGARDWNEGSPPDQMTMHTEMSDDRRAGFLHLRLVRKADGRRIDLALPDLPGEWTTKLVASSQSERLDFLKAAEVIWMVLDGRTLADKERRQALISRVGQLAGRLKTMLGDRLPRVLLVVTHRDGGALTDNVSARLTTELKRKGLDATIMQVAPFSDSDDVRAGHGIAELIDATAGPKQIAPEFWPGSVPRDGIRSFLSYRRDQ